MIVRYLIPGTQSPRACPQDEALSSVPHPLRIPWPLYGCVGCVNARGLSFPARPVRQALPDCIPTGGSCAYTPLGGRLPAHHHLK
jgi:hypothetical protein